MAIDKLPTEILLQILIKHVGCRYLRGHLFVCKLWFNLLKPILYRSVRLNEQKLRKLQDLMHESTRSGRDLMSVFDTFPHTQGLSITEKGSAPPLETNAFLFLLTLFPVLTELDLYTENCSHYLKIIDTCDVEKLPPIKSILPTDIEDVEDADFHSLYFSVYYKLRHTLQYIQMRYFEDVSINYGKGILDVLSEFKHLTQIEFDNKFDPNLTIFHILKAFPQLEGIVFESAYSTPRNVDAVITDLLNYIREKRSTTDEHFKNVRMIEIRQPDLTQSCAEFFTTYCPPNLKRLHFQLDESDFYTWIRSLTLPVAIGFAKTLSKIRSAGIIFDQINNNSIVGRDSVNFGQKINAFYRFLEAFKGGRCTSTAYFDYEMDDLSTSANFLSDEHSVIYWYTLNHVDYGVIPTSSNVELNELRHYHTYTFPTPESGLIDQSTSNLNFTLPLDCISNLPAVYLDYTAKYYKKLKSIKVYYQNPESHFTAKHETDVRSPLKDMNSVSIGGAEYSQEIIDKLYEYIPNMTIFRYVLSDGFDSDLDELYINLSKFDKLQSFIVDFEDIDDMGFAQILVQIKRKGSEKTVNYILLQDGEDRFELKSTNADHLNNEYLGGGSYLIFVEGPQQLENIRFHIVGDINFDLNLKELSVN